MVVSDIDGTIVPWSGELSPRIIAAVHELTSAGIRFTLATGRRRKMALPIAQAIGVVDPVIAFDGAALFDPDSGVCIHAQTMDESLVNPVLEAADQHTRLMTYVQADPHHSDKVFARSRQAQEFLATIYPQIAGDLEQCTVLSEACSSPIRILIFGEMADLKLLLADLVSWPGRLGIWTSFPVPVVECYGPGIDKGYGLATLTERLDIDMDKVIAVGDDLNDLALLKAAGLGIAVANARPEVLAIADCVCKDVEDDGVAELLSGLAVGRLPATKRPL